MPFHAILFDIGDTLWHAPSPPPPAAFRRIAAARAAALLQDLGITDVDAPLASRIAWDALEAAMRAARATDLVEPDYATVCQAALAQRGIRLSSAEAARLLDAIYVSGAEGGKEACPGARETLLTLRRRGFALGVVTNRSFGGDRFRADLRDTGLDIGWDASAVSVEVGYLKPHPRIFVAALEALEAAPSETLMVGNSLLEDVSGAQALGMSAAWKRCPPDAEGVVPDLVFDDITELLELPELGQAAP